VDRQFEAAPGRPSALDEGGVEGFDAPSQRADKSLHGVIPSSLPGLARARVMEAMSHGEAR